MLGTRSATERERLASIVGATRQWVTSIPARFQARGILQIKRGAIIIERANLLQELDM